jgi:hypothetical protein
LIYPIISQGPKFSFEHSGHFINDKCFMILAGRDLNALLNSKLGWFWLFGEASPLRGGKWRLELREQYVSRFPVPEASAASRQSLIELARACGAASRERFDIQSAVRRRILDLASVEGVVLTGRLAKWHELGFKDFRTEVRRSFRVDIPVKERGEWEAYLGENAARVKSLSEQITAAEREIDRIVYDLFELTSEEIALLEASLEGQH